MTIVDTSVWIDYFSARSNVHTEWLDENLGSHLMGLTDLILCEILQGVRHDSMFRRLERELQAYEVIATCGTDLATASAANYRKLRAIGLTVRTTVDCLIATLCLEKGYSLLHRDRDFDAFEAYLGLHVIHPKVG